MKKIMTFLFMMTCVLTFSDVVSGKRIQVRGIAKKEIFPNSAKVELVIKTQDENLDKERKHMKQF